MDAGLKRNLERGSRHNAQTQLGNVTLKTPCSILSCIAGFRLDQALRYIKLYRPLLKSYTIGSHKQWHI